MLYDAYETTRRLMMPAAHGANAFAQALLDPSSVLSRLPLARQLAAGPELWFRLTKDYPKPAFGIHEVQRNGQRLAVLETEVSRTPFCRLLHFQRFAQDPATLGAIQNDPIVLVVAPLSGHHATLLRDTVKTLLQDHQVYITDWLDARQVPLSEGEFSLDDYVKTIEGFMTHIGTNKVHVMAVCQPVVPVMAAVSRLSTQGLPTPRSMILIGGPIDARQSPTAVNNLATQKPYAWFEQNVIHRVPQGYPGAGRRVYPGFLQHMGFVAMNPEKHTKAHWEFFEDLLKGDKEDADTHRAFYDEYNAVLDLPAEYYLQTIRQVFQQHQLAQGTWDVDGVRIRPQDIKKTRLMTIEGERDDIAGQGQTQAAHALCSGIPEKKKVHLLAKGAGHYGLFSGRRWREEIYPAVREFVARLC
jgi:poly(3-hydroxybutyrate) depolymerase